MEQKLFKLLLNYEFYSNNKHRILRTMFGKSAEELYDTLVDAHEKYCKDISEQDLLQLHISRNPTLTQAKKDNLTLFISELSDVDTPDKEIAVEVLENTFRTEIARQIAEKAIQTINTGNDTFSELELLVSQAREGIISQQAYTTVTSDLDILIPLLNTTAAYKFNIESLQPIVSGIGPGILSIFFARPECYMPDTEVLTARGWVKFKDLLEGEKVYQERDDTLELVAPNKYIKRHHNGNIINFKDTIGRINLSVTPEHDMIVDGVKISAKEFIPKQGNKLQTSSLLCGNNYHLNNEERLLIAYQADGSSYRNGCNGNRSGHRTVRFGFKKDRKKRRLIKIINNLKWEYTISLEKSRQGYHTIYVKWPLDCYLQPTKQFNWDILINKSYLWCQEFIEELSYWDATRRSEISFKYDTVEKQTADLVQAIAVCAGYNVKYSVRKDTRKEQYKDVYTLYIRAKYSPIDGQSVKKHTSKYEGYVYCVSVPSGRILVRSNNQTLICGNCGKTGFWVSLTSSPNGFAWQGAKVCALINEEPAVRTRARSIMAATGMGVQQLSANKPKAKSIYDKIKDNIIMMDAVGLDITDVEQCVKEVKPDIIIVDQIDKVGIKGVFNRGDERLKELYVQMREIVKRYDCAGIVISQANAEAEGKLNMTMDMLENSRTGKAAEADLIIGVGKSNSPGQEDLRQLNIIKNKITGMHEPVLVKLNPTISRYEA